MQLILRRSPAPEKLVEGESLLLSWDSLEEGAPTTSAMLDIFIKCLQLQQRKASTYGEAFRSQGYMGNVARVLSKVSRLKKMLWSDVVVSDSDETVEDTARDLINLAVFFLINREDRNKWGNDRV